MARSILRPVGCYIYTHRKATTGEIFYVGKGTAERAWDRYGRSKFWCHVVQKHGVVIEIEAQGLGESEANAMERAWIARLKAEGAKLVNLTDGGEGTLNPTAETRAKISAAHKGKKKSPDVIEKIRQGNLGKTRSEETKAKLRQRTYSDETRARMSASGKCRQPPSDAALAKLSAASKAMWRDPEYRSKVLSAVTGKKRSAEFSKKMSEIAISRPAPDDDSRERTRAVMLSKWSDPDYRSHMQKVHAGVGWSEARRAAHERKRAAKASLSSDS